MTPDRSYTHWHGLSTCQLSPVLYDGIPLPLGRSPLRNRADKDGFRTTHKNSHWIGNAANGVLLWRTYRQSTCSTCWPTHIGGELRLVEGPKIKNINSLNVNFLKNQSGCSLKAYARQNVCLETITEIINFRLLRCNNYVTARN